MVQIPQIICFGKIKGFRFQLYSVIFESTDFLNSRDFSYWILQAGENLQPPISRICLKYENGMESCGNLECLGVPIKILGVP